MPLDRDIFVQNIERYCAIKGVTPTVACRDSGVSSSFLVNIKRGQTPSVAKVQQLAQYLGCTVSDLLGEQSDANNSSLPKESELLRKITALSPEYREKAEEYLDFLTGLQDKQ